MGKGDKKSKRGKIIMGSYGVTRPKKKKQSYKFVPRPKKESVEAMVESSVEKSPAVASEISALEQSVKPKKKTSAKSAKK